MRARALTTATLIAVAAACGTLGATTHQPVPTTATFTADQAYQGRFTYIQNCAECHGGDLGGQFAPALAGPSSNVPWQTPGAVFTYMIGQMPVGNAGGLSPTEYINVEAFILQSNGRRAGRTRLTRAAVLHDLTHLDGSR